MCFAGSPSSTGSDSVSFTKLDGDGHLDVLCGNDSEEKVFAPVLRFVKQHQK